MPRHGPLSERYAGAATTVVLCLVPYLALTAAVFPLTSAISKSLHLSATSLDKTTGPTTAGLLYPPEFGAAVAMAAIFDMLFRTRYTPILAISGLVVIVGAAALLLEVGTTASPLVALAAGMLGLGVGASVSPALFVAGFSLRSSQVQRVFALVELLRGVTAFLVAPILLFLSAVLAASATAGLLDAYWICLAIAGGGAVAGVGLLWAGRVRLQTPNLPRWQETHPAWHSPQAFARFRPETEARAAAELDATASGDDRGARRDGPTGAARHVPLGADGGERRPPVASCTIGAGQLRARGRGAGDQAPPTGST